MFFAGGSGTAQTLDEMAFERGVWTAAIDGDSSRHAWHIYYFTNKITLPLSRLFLTPLCDTGGETSRRGLSFFSFKF